MKHHVFKSTVHERKWYHCGYCPCDTDMRYEEPYDHSRCINAHPETITMMQETGMFGLVNKNTWWLKQWK